MNETKPLLKSKGVWGSVGAMVSSVALFFVSHTPADRLFAINSFLFACVALYGRIVAKHRLVIKKEKPNV